MQKTKSAQLIIEDADFQRFTGSFHGMIESGIMQGQIVQYSPRDGLDQVMGFRSRKAGLVHTRFPHEACVRTGQPTGQVTFTLPLTPSDEWTINGAAGHKHAIFVNFGLDETQIFAPQRNLVAGGVQTDLLLKTLGELGEHEPDESDIPRGPLSLDAATYQGAANRFLQAIYRSQSFDDRETVEHLVATTLASVLYKATPLGTEQARHMQEIFDAAQKHLVRNINRVSSIQDLCRRTGVSAPTLTRAFNMITGRTPAQYVKHVKLAHAHRMLTVNDVKNVSVSTAATASGFSDLGRFSRSFKNAYGILPSVASGR